MKLLPLALVFVASGALAVLSVRQMRLQRERQHLMSDVAAARAQLAAAQRQLSNETARASDLDRQLLALDAELGKTKSRLSATELRNVELTRTLARARDDLAAAEQRAQASSKQISTLEPTRGGTPTASPASAVSTAAPPVALVPAPAKPAEPLPPAPIVPTASTVTILATTVRPGGPVVGVGPANSFVILDYGRHRGAAAGQTLAVRRGTALVAQVLITDARPRFSIAHVQPDSLRGVLQKGDSAVLTD